MENTLNELKVVHSSSLIIILFNNSLRIYDEDANLLEYISNILSDNGVIIIKLKYLEMLKNILKDKKISYVILDKENDYRVYSYYCTDKNKYYKYLELSKKYNRFRRYIVLFCNFMFGIPLNRYK